MRKIQKLALKLKQKNTVDKRSWRDIAEKDYLNRINFATLRDFANGEGEYIPADKKLQAVLGLSPTCQTCKRKLPAPRTPPAPPPDYMAWWRKQPKAKRAEIIRAAHRISETW